MQAHEETENKTHRNFEPPGVQYHNTEESHQQGNDEINNREPVDIVFRDIVVPSSEVRYGGKGEPHLWREAVQLMKEELCPTAQFGSLVPRPSMPPVLYCGCRRPGSEANNGHDKLNCSCASNYLFY